MKETDKDIDEGHRRLLAAVVVRAVEDLALVRAGFLLRTVQPGNTLFDKVPYPKKYFRAMGYSITDDPINELIDFFNSDYFKGIARILEPTMGFRITGEQVLKKKSLPGFWGMENVRGQRKKRTEKL